MEQRIAAMRAEGFSIRQIARELRLSRMKVHRVLAASPAVPAAVADPVLSLLTADDLQYMRWTADDVAAGRNALHRYRLQRLASLPRGVSAAADALRELHGDALQVWMFAGEPDEAAVPGEPVPAHVRDDRVVELRRQGATLAQIGAQVGMTKGAVSRALERIYDGRPGQRPYG